MTKRFIARYAAIPLLIAVTYGSVAGAEKPANWVAKKKWTLKHDRLVNCVRFSPDGKRVLTAAFDLTLRLWDVASGRQLKIFQGHKAFDLVNDIAWSPDGRYAMLAMGQYKGNQRLTRWDIDKWKQESNYVGHRHAVTRVVLSRNGRRALSGSTDATVCYWNVETGENKSRFLPAVARTNRIGAYRPDGWTKSLDISSDGQRGLWAGGGLNYQLWLFDLSTGRPERAFVPPPSEPSPQHVVDAVFTKDARRILAAHSYGFLRIWDVESGKSSPALRISPDVIASISYAEDAGLILVGGHNGRLALWNVEGVGNRRPVVRHLLTLQEPHPAASRTNQQGQHVAGVARVVLSPGATHAAAADHDGTVRIWKLSRKDGE